MTSMGERAEKRARVRKVWPRLYWTETVVAVGTEPYIMHSGEDEGERARPGKYPCGSKRESGWMR